MAMSNAAFNGKMKSFVSNMGKANAALVELLSDAVQYAVENNSGQRLGIVLESIEGDAQLGRALAWANQYAVCGLHLSASARPLSRAENPDKKGAYITKVSADAVAAYTAGNFDLVSADIFAASNRSPMAWKGVAANAEAAADDAKKFDAGAYATKALQHVVRSGGDVEEFIKALREAAKANLMKLDGSEAKAA